MVNIHLNWQTDLELLYKLKLRLQNINCCGQRQVPKKLQLSVHLPVQFVERI